MGKSENAYKTISEVVEIIGLKPKKGKLKPTHTLRYWEKEFNQIKPKFFNNNRRHYDTSSIEVLKLIKFLLKSEGMTIQGVKKHLNQNKSNLDDSVFSSIRTKYFRNRLSNLKNIIKELKK